MYIAGCEWFNVQEPLSARKHLQGKVVVMDFFTYCCINCMHILPDLHALQHRHSQCHELVVLGVHSAKFDNEKVSANILSAVLRYDITHPVVNDCEASLWFKMQIQCWPTLVVVNPHNHIMLVLMGEAHMKTLNQFVDQTLQYYKAKGELKSHSIGVVPSKETLPTSPLLFPGKVSVDECGERLAVSDTAHHRLVITDTTGLVQVLIDSP